MFAENKTENIKTSQKDQKLGTLWTKQFISSYADTVNKILPVSRKQNSLWYSKNHHSFQVTKYSYDGKPVLYIEKENNTAHGKTEKRYYIKDNRIALYTKTVIDSTSNNSSPSATYSYYRQDSLFRAETFLDKRGETTNTSKTIGQSHLYNHLAALEDALQQRGDFNLVFEGVTEYPKAKYIILSRNRINSYRAPLKVEKEDEFIHELRTNPDRYRGEKLNIRWHCANNNEVVYQASIANNN